MTDPAKRLAEIRQADRRKPVMMLSELFALDPAEVHEGYMDGFDGLTCGDNRSRAYWHGWRCSMMDKNKIEIDDAHRVLVHEIVRFPGGPIALAEHHRRVYPELKAMGLAE